MENDIKFFEKGLEEYPKSTIITENLAMSLWLVLGFISCWFFHPIAGVLYIIFALVMVYFVLRKLVCTNCYYYNNWCHLGWGKLSSKFFKKGDIKEFRNCLGIKMALPTYASLMIIPLILIVISILLEFSYYKIIVLVLLLLVSSYSAGISRKDSCAKCKMRLMCPGSAVK